MKAVRSSLTNGIEVINEGENLTHVIAFDEDTSGGTLTALIVLSGYSEYAIVGTASGDSEESDVSITLSLNDRYPDRYTYELWFNHGEDDQQLVFPDVNESNFVIQIQDRVGVTNSTFSL